MKIGVLCEGAKTDQQVLELFLNYVFKDHNVSFMCEGVSKKDLFDEEGYGALLLYDLFSRGVDRALIVWDLIPTGVKNGIPSQWSERPSRREQRQMFLERLRESEDMSENLRQQARYLYMKYGFDVTAVEHPNGGVDFFKLVCVCYTLDGWFLSDRHFLRQLATGSFARPAEPCANEHPDRCKNPVAILETHFERGYNPAYKGYNKMQHNLLLAQAYCDNNKVHRIKRSSRSFRRLIEAVEGWLGI